MAGFINDNIMGEAMALNIEGRSDFSQPVAEMQVLSSLTRELKSDILALNGALGTDTTQISQSTREAVRQLDVQSQIFDIRRSLLTISKENVSSLEDEAQKYTKIIALAQQLKSLGGTGSGADVNVADLHGRVITPEIQQQLLGASGGTELEDKIKTGSILASMSKNQELLKGLLGASAGTNLSLISSLNQVNEGLQKIYLGEMAEHQPTTSPVETMAPPKKVVPESSKVKDAEMLLLASKLTAGGSNDGEEEGGDESSGTQSFHQKVAQNLFNKTGFGSLETAIQKLSGSLSGIPMIGGALTSLTKAIGPELESIGEMVIPVAIAATAVKEGYNQYVNFAKQERSYESIEGSGASAGQTASYDIMARTLAMSPFLSDAQARQIIQSALSSGFRGETADNAISFVADNFKAMNFDIGTSMELYKTNVVEAGGSTAALSSAIQSLNATASLGGTNLTTLGQQYASNSSTITGLGGGPQSSSVALALTGGLSGLNESISGLNIGDMLSTTQGQALVAQSLGISYNALPAFIHKGTSGTPQEADKVSSEITNAINKTFSSRISQYVKPGESAKEIEGSSLDNQNQLAAVMSTLKGKTLTVQQAANLAATIMSPGGLTKAVATEEEKSSGAKKSGTAEKKSSIGTDILGGLIGAIGTATGSPDTTKSAGTLGKETLSNLNQLWNLNPFESAAGREENVLKGAVTTDEVQSNVNDPLVNKLINSPDGNLRNTSVTSSLNGGKEMPIGEFISKYGERGLAQLQSGAALVGTGKGWRDGKTYGGTGIESLEAKYAPVAAALNSSKVPTTHAGTTTSATSKTTQATVQSYTIDLSSDASQFLTLIKKLGQTNGVYNQVVSENAKVGLGYTNDARDGNS